MYKIINSFKKICIEILKINKQNNPYYIDAVILMFLIVIMMF